MTLKPTDMLEIQSAIDAYERKFPKRAAPTAEVALAWRLGKKEWARRQAAAAAAEKVSDEPAPTAGKRGGKEKTKLILAEEEGSRLVWLSQQLGLRSLTRQLSPQAADRFEEDDFDNPAPLLKGVLRIGLWGVVAVLVASVFLLGAIVGGFK
ncbi:MAG TPA: hypothetical protein VMB49_20635 [Acidobacteriaceae bacterium]|nr:hypothetical protein [Acidobacteriaceae bacterium]